MNSASKRLRRFLCVVNLSATLPRSPANLSIGPFVAKENHD